MFLCGWGCLRGKIYSNRMGYLLYHPFKRTTQTQTHPDLPPQYHPTPLHSPPFPPLHPQDPPDLPSTQLKNKEATIPQKKEYSLKNKEAIKLREQKRDYKVTIEEKKRGCAPKDMEKEREKKRRYNLKHKEVIKEKKRLYYPQHKENIQETQ
eukprot:TRINITY_DN9502_c0_g1_i1.p1 TRINITY_DN9502_c0_g1~~TRINITY_DN9502_c0_g1_i1.p1  ORF type:complete len:152 (+),score=60.74 TRINITY_DN9502_c0_g1_i1:13-468(+)